MSCTFSFWSALRSSASSRRPPPGKRPWPGPPPQPPRPRKPYANAAEPLVKTNASALAAKTFFTTEFITGFSSLCSLLGLHPIERTSPPSG